MSLYRFILCLTKWILRTFYKIKVTGLENLPQGGALLAANHISYLDPPLVAISSPSEVHFLARDTLFKGCFGKFITKLNAHPVSDHHNLDAVKLLVKLLGQEHKIVIFPEGARSFDGKVQDIKPGIGLIMKASKKPIIPIYIEGVFSIWPRERAFPRLRGNITVHFGKPLLWEDFAMLPKGEVQDRIAEALKGALLTISASSK